jgi:spermidine/putrescine-binding protein
MDPRLARSLDELSAAERLSRRRFIGRAGGTGLALSSLPAYEPEVSAKIAAAVNYIPPVAGVQDVLAKGDPKLAEDPLIFPSDEIRAKPKPYPVLSPADERTVQQAMDKVTGG